MSYSDDHCPNCDGPAEDLMAYPDRIVRRCLDVTCQSPSGKRHVWFEPRDVRPIRKGGWVWRDGATVPEYRAHDSQSAIALS